MTLRAVGVVVLVLPLVGAQQQCLPGPFEYDGPPEANALDRDDALDGGEGERGVAGEGEPPGGEGEGEGALTPGEGEGEGFDIGACVDDDTCIAAFGPKAHCEAGRCLTPQTCPLGVANSCGVPGESCAYDATSQFPRDQGTCRPEAPSAIAAGEGCSVTATDVNPCADDAFCLPFDGERGMCVKGCGVSSACDDGFQCSSPFLGGGGPALCMPACNLDAPSCGDPLLACSVANFNGGSCTPDNGVCTIVSCDFNGDCLPGCDGDEVCPDGTACRELVLDNCRVDGPEQAFAVCRPPGQQNALCVLEDETSCDNGLACLPSNDGARCQQQTSSPAADGAPCNPNDFSANRCASGAYCARTIDNTGVCQRFCSDNDECGADQLCANANLAGQGGFFSETLRDVRVCADRCIGGSACDAGFICDVDGALCTANEGACLPQESFDVCSDDDDCAFRPGTVCSGDRRCVAPDDACVLDECDLLDPSTCSAGFACSPFDSETPRCVPQTAEVVADGQACFATPDAAPCAPGSLCSNGVCMRACGAAADCGGTDACVRGNVLDMGSHIDDPFHLSDVTVCAATCIAFEFCGTQLTCDVDDGGQCSSGVGHCLPFENSPRGCANNGDCASVPGTVCNPGQGTCVPAADVCIPG